MSVVRQAVKMALCLLPPFKRLFAERDAAVAARNAVGGRVQPLGLPKILVETDATIEQFDKMLGYMKRTWKKLGESEPYFSVSANEPSHASTRA